MRRVTGRIAVFVVLLVAAFAAAVLLDERFDHQTVMKRVRNDSLETIKPDWPGNAVDEKDRFMDERYTYVPSLVKVLKWKLHGNDLKDAKAADTWKLEVHDPSDFLSSGRDGIMWLGHASFYIRIGGVGILTDPVFGDPMFLKRFVPVASQLDQIPRVDYVLLSHDHRDHTDAPSLKAIAARFPNATFVAGLRSEDVLGSLVGKGNRVMTAGWFQRFDIPDERVKIYFLPARHWSRRSLMDTNWRLWGSFIIQAGGKTIYFGGDSAYAEYFREVGELFPKIDYFIVGIGAYEPRWFMSPIHKSPEEALRGFMDAHGGVLIPMHYGTFDLSDEPPGEPLRALKMAADEAGVVDKIRPLAINEALLVE